MAQGHWCLPLLMVFWVLEARLFVTANGLDSSGNAEAETGLDEDRTNINNCDDKSSDRYIQKGDGMNSAVPQTSEISCGQHSDTTVKDVAETSNKKLDDKAKASSPNEDDEDNMELEHVSLSDLQAAKERISQALQQQTRESEQPVQLLRPDPDKHVSLQVVRSGLAFLSRVQPPVAVVAVVGKYHTGKSFLLNQLMGKQQGFGVGPTVQPETMGVWMWGKPLPVPLPSGEQLNVIFLDTEGFAASNVSESYDAKIFAIASLLSSYLIFNSVKIIDQADIDYLELLARRTQLFALRSQMAKAEWIDRFNHDLLEFPPLLWVVQDFVQVGVNEETAQAWLHRLMRSSARESEKYDISLLGIFKKVDCHTLFLPAIKKRLLQDLSQATEDDLTEEYRQERDELLNKLRQGLSPKEKNGQPINGAELAVLVEILVNAANEGSIAEMPGRWNAFTQHLKETAFKDCLLYFDGELELLMKQYNYDALGEDILKSWYNLTGNRTTSLLEQLLYGLGNAFDEAQPHLIKEMAVRYARAADLNEKRIQLRCHQAQREAEIEAEDKLEKVGLPVPSAEMQEKVAKMKEDSIDLYYREAQSFNTSHAFHNHFEHLRSDLENIAEKFLNKNQRSLESLLENAKEKALETVADEVVLGDRLALTTAQLRDKHSAAVEKAVQLFKEHGSLAKDERFFEPYLASVKVAIGGVMEQFVEDNNRRVKVHCEEKILQLVEMFRDSTGPRTFSLPMNESDLLEKLNTQLTLYEVAFQDSLSAYNDTKAYMAAVSTLQTRLEGVIDERQKDNMKAYAREVEIPLNTAKKLILLSADKYDTAFSLENYMREVCLLQLDEGKAKDWQESLKLQIITHFISKCDVLQATLRARHSFFADLKGFVQWLWWRVTCLLSPQRRLSVF